MKKTDAHLLDQLQVFNELWKEQDDIWQAAAKKSGISDTAFWVMYVLTVDTGAPLTQSDMCDRWYIPRQTCNSAVKKLQMDGLVELSTAQGRGNTKYVTMTDAGRAFADKYIQPLADAGISSFAGFSDEERELLISFMRRMLDNLKAGIKYI